MCGRYTRQAAYKVFLDYRKLACPLRCSALTIDGLSPRIIAAGCQYR